LSVAVKRWAWLAWLFMACAAHAGGATNALRHSSTNYCSREATLSARQQDRLLRLAQAAREVLSASGSPAAVIARSGLDLGRFGLRYSHAGLSLKEGSDLSWGIRQLYYACDERRPRVFEQGLAGFVMGVDQPETVFLSLTLLPSEHPRTQALLSAARDDVLAKSLLAERYSANAYAYGLTYQNCNQWLAELIGLAWAPDGPSTALNPRAAAQQSLLKQGYQARAVPIDSHALMLAAHFMPLIHLDDHPQEDRFALALRVSLPDSIDAFVRVKLPQARRIEMCLHGDHVVVRREGPALPASCEAGEGDEVLALD
jgi:hypothetical protein